MRRVGGRLSSDWEGETEMRNIVIGVAATTLLAACSSDAPAPPAEEVAAASLQPGEYEITAKVEAVKSTDKSTPRTKAKVGDAPAVTRVCVPADGSLAAEVFAEGKETCTAMDNYMRNGRMNLQFKCKSGSDQLTQMADGTFKKDSFEAKVSTATYFTGDGDYELTRSFTGKRVGDCPVEPAKS